MRRVYDYIEPKTNSLQQFLDEDEIAYHTCYNLVEESIILISHLRQEIRDWTFRTSYQTVNSMPQVKQYAERLEHQYPNQLRSNEEALREDFAQLTAALSSTDETSSYVHDRQQELDLYGSPRIPLQTSGLSTIKEASMRSLIEQIRTRYAAIQNIAQDLQEIQGVLNRELLPEDEYTEE